MVAIGLLVTGASSLLLIAVMQGSLYPPLLSALSSSFSSFSLSSSSSSSLGSIKYSRVRVIRSTVDNYSIVELSPLRLPQQQQQLLQQRVVEPLEDGQRWELDAEAGGGGKGDAANGYLSRNGSNLEFHSYGKDVDLRIIVFAFDRPTSLNICLTAIEEADYAAGDRVSLHVWIDRADGSGGVGNDSTTDPSVDAETLAVARGFNFTHGRLFVHVQPTPVGVQGQWMHAWRPGRRTKEIALLLEDDITVSPFFWRWLKRAHAAYARFDDVSGFSVSHPEMEHKNGGLLEVSVNDTIFMYRVICTWGFSPRPDSWRAFQDWFDDVERNGTFLPVVRGILPTEWFLSERNKGKERTLWEQWHIYYTNMVKQYTVMLNPGRRGLLAVNRHEMGLHDGHVVVGATQPLCVDWSPEMDRFPETLPKYGYDGLREADL